MWKLERAMATKPFVEGKDGDQSGMCCIVPEASPGSHCRHQACVDTFSCLKLLECIMTTITDIA